MAKVENIAVPVHEIPTKGQLVGLSNCPNLTAKIFFTEFRNGEASIRIVDSTSFNLTSPPPTRSGELIQQGLTKRGASKIKRTVRMFQDLIENRKKSKAYCSFITLTYPLVWADDKLSKIHLDHFLKRIKRKIPNYIYVWVAERQRRGAIHYHILSPDFVDKEIINKAWSEIVSKWYKKEGLEFTGVYPNVIKVYNASAYMTKYMTKEEESIKGNMYGMSESARKLIEPIGEMTIDVPESKANEIILNALYSGKPLYHFKGRDYKQNYFVWLPDAKDILHRIREQSLNDQK